jgi:hypothetical protein
MLRAPQFARAVLGASMPQVRIVYKTTSRTASKFYLTLYTPVKISRLSVY